MIVTFFGHRDTPQHVQPLLQAVLEDCICRHDAKLFYVGHQGSFDRLVQKTLQRLAVDHPHIDYAVVLAYMPGKKEASADVLTADTLFPEGLESVPRRYAIVKRNRWMLEKADTVITYVTHPTGGAAQSKRLAESKGKRVINLPDLL